MVPEQFRFTKLSSLNQTTFDWQKVSMGWRPGTSPFFPADLFVRYHEVVGFARSTLCPEP